MALFTKPVIELEEGWSHMKKAVTKLTRILEEEPVPAFDANYCLGVYTTIYTMCVQNSPHDYAEQLYDKYHGIYKEYHKETVLPSLREKHDEYLLRELVKRWGNCKTMVKLLAGFCHYLDRYYVLRTGSLTLTECGLTCFRDLVYREIHSKAKDVILALIHKEREGEQIDRAILKNVIDVFIENGMGKMERYEEDFESFMLQDTASYYSSTASRWIQEDSCPAYMIKTEECLKKERERITHYLHSLTEPKLIEIVQDELLVRVSKQLLENENSGCLALLRNDKMDDLSRMYKLHYPIPQGLEPIADLFKQHVIAEGNALIKQAADAATDQAAGTGGVHEHVLIRKVIELHDKYIVYVMDCFQNHGLFHKVLKEAFEIFCNKTVAGVSSAEILATFCDTILKRGGGSEKLSDEAIEDTLEKVVKLLVYIHDKDIFAEFYRKKQARRLLDDRSGSDEHERSLLTKLKEQCGEQFTSKMEEMLTDMTLANQMRIKRSRI